MSTSSVVITDVVLRDGLQDEDVIVATADKVAIAESLMAAGVTNIEAVSFVSPLRVPQMADADELMQALSERRNDRVRFSVLALNGKGVERAAASGADLIEIAASASPSHSRANAGKTSERALADLADALVEWPERTFIGAVSTAFVCPFDGVISSARLVEVVKSLAAMGVERIGLADTLGTATTDHVLRSVDAVRDAVPEVELGLHLHNADGQALQTALAAATELEIVHFDSAIGGYGGCPFAPGAHGNVATEELVAHFHSNGIDTGIDERALAVAVRTVQSTIARSPAHT
ncbi:hydroxymethylglutaryl-CoA lyase [Rhodococcoides yunnanense]|uniref:hydroxymethylglutaryl-CoA lyase n=1 Tax=Rhodococcoides yunnanense TaxID=278209 RepID=UPI0009327C55|nr:hydroxymethylglutaryl-CoA lyase [Rhodococcus yunnanensis]